MLIGGMCADDLKAIIPMSPAWMIPEIARQGSLLGMDFDPQHIPETIPAWGGALSGDYIRVAQTIHVEDEIARYDGPVLLIHGTDDGAVPFSYSEKALKLYKNAKLVPIEGDGHCYENHLDKVLVALNEFFKEQLAK